MLFTYFIIGVALSIPEIILVNHTPWLKKMTRTGIRWWRINIPGPVFEILFSLGFGMLVAIAVGIGPGVTFAAANVFSTIISKMVYDLEIMERCAVMKKKYFATKASILGTKAQVIEFFVAVRQIFRIIFFIPIQLLRLSRFLGQRRAQRAV